MKKLISFVLSLSLIISLIGCSGSKPDATVTSFCDAIKVFDFAAASSYMENSEDLEDPSAELETEDAEAEQFIDYLKENAGKMTYVVGESQVDGDNATVPVSFTYVDTSPVMTSVLGEYMSQAFVLALSGASEEQMGELFVNIFSEKVKTVEAGTATTDITFNCVKVDGDWKIKSLSEEDSTTLANIMTSNFAVALDNFGEGLDEETTEDIPEEDVVWHDVPLGQNTEFATMNIKITGCEEKQELTAEYLDPDVAQDGTKYVVVSMALENTTKESLDFDGELPLTDSEGRTYEPYFDATWYYDNYLAYENLAPNIVLEGVLVYQVPSDSVDYFMPIMKGDTNDGYRLLLR